MKIMQIRFLIAFAFLLLSFSQTRAQSLLQNGEIPSDLIITLERTFCGGDCPTYKLTVTADRVVKFLGEENTIKIGSAKSKISKEKLRQLIAEFQKSDFFKFRDEYESGEICEQYATDFPSEIISIQINGKSKKVLHNFGCWGEKAKIELTPLVNLGENIDKITNSRRWVGKQKK
jgi:hypothetical protein